MRVLRLPLAVVALLIGVTLMGGERSAQALPPAGSDLLPVVATVDVTSRLGDETVLLTGWVRIDRSAPYDDGGVEVVDIQIESLDLRGTSSIGAITAVERPDVGPSYASTGEIRSLNPGEELPASSFFDLFVNITVPATPGGSMVTHNEGVLHLTPREGGVEVDLDAWPPLGVTYELEPIYNVDNDGDTQIDEDTADEDGDGLVDEDRPGADPDTPGTGGECGTNADCDDEEGEDPPATWCVANSSTICDDDGDGLMDEDPDCVPLMNSGNINNMKAGLCVRNISLEIAPELASYSAGRGGPSGLHPADILGLTPGDPSGGGGDPLSLVTCNDDTGGFQSQVNFTAVAGETYRIQVGSYASSSGGSLTLDVAGGGAPVAVSGNDNFANAWLISSSPFTGTQSTVGTSVQSGEPLSCLMGSKTVWYSYTPSSTGSLTIDTFGSGFDSVLAVYTGDTFGPGPSPSEQAPFLRIPCVSLGLSADGCDTGGDGDQDNLDALSFGNDEFAGETPELNFSVAPGAQGAPGSAVEEQRNCPPSSPGASPEPEGDEFASAMGGTNQLVLDGNGPVGACASAFPLGFVEAATVRDDLDAVHGKDPTAVDPDQDGVPDSPVYFSLDAASPSLGTLGASAADILKSVGGGSPTMYAPRLALGLQASDDVDAVCLSDNGDAFYGPSDSLYFSLAPGSPTLGAIGAAPGDVLAPGSPPTVAHTAASLGLAAGDDLDALKCRALPDPNDPDADADGDTIPNGVDPDDDNDGCTDVQELGPDPSLGGMRDPLNFWDVFDVPTGTPPLRDKQVFGQDISSIVARFGANDEGPGAFDRFSDPLSTPNPVTGDNREDYHPAYDRTPLGPNAWNLGPPDGSVFGQDVGLVVVQFGDDCS